MTIKIKGTLTTHQRKNFNLLILEKIKQLLIKHPELRFCQALSILGIEGDKFNEEPNVTYNNIIENVKNIT